MLNEFYERFNWIKENEEGVGQNYGEVCFMKIYNIYYL